MVLAWRARRKLPFHQSFRNGFSAEENRSPSPDRLDSGRFVGSEVSDQPLLRREMLCAIPPLLFGKRISWLALIMGESRDSGQGPGLDQMAKDGKSRKVPERFKGEI